MAVIKGTISQATAPVVKPSGKVVNKLSTKRKPKGYVFGRPTKYLPRFAKELIAFFDVIKNEKWIKSEKIITKSNGTTETYREYAFMAKDLPTLEKFAHNINVNKDTIVEWATARYPKDYAFKNLAGRLKHVDFSVAYTRAKQLQKEFLVDNALKGLYPPNSFIFVAKNFTDMRDKVEQEITSKGKRIVGFTMIMRGENGGRNSQDVAGA